MDYRVGVSLIDAGIIAIMMASGWPQNSIDFVGILVGFCVISGGMGRIMLGRALRTELPAP